MTNEDARTARSPRDARARRTPGFTLLEIMIVLAIIGLIAGGVGVAVFKQFKKAQVKIAKTAREGGLATPSTQFMIDNNSSCPKGMEDLVAQKYLDKNNAKDPWGKDFTHPVPGHQRHRQRRHLVVRPRQAGRHRRRHQVLGV